MQTNYNINTNQTKNRFIKHLPNSQQVFFYTHLQKDDNNQTDNLGNGKNVMNSIQDMQKILQSNIGEGIRESRQSSNKAYNRIEEKIVSKYEKNKNIKNKLSRGHQETNSINKSNKNLQQIRQNKYMQNRIFGNNSPIDFFSSDYFQIDYVQSNKKSQPDSSIKIQKTLLKPIFGFKDSADINQQQTMQTQDDLISFQDSSIVNKLSINNSSSASNFFDVLNIQQNKTGIKLVKNGDLQGYMLSKIDKKQQNIAKKLQQVKKNNQLYSKKIKQKERQIQMMSKRMEKQQKQMQVYQSKMALAYQNFQQNSDSLLISSRNYEVSNQKMQLYVRNKTKIYCPFKGLHKKVIKEVLYGKCMILDTNFLQIGFDNKTKPGIFQLYFTIKQNLSDMQVFIENAQQYGYIFEDGFNMKVHNVPANKKIKVKVNVNYNAIQKQSIGLMCLKIILKLNQNSSFTQTAILPFTLYRNYFVGTTLPKLQAQNLQRYSIITQWQNSCDELIKDPKSYLNSLFKQGVWLAQNIFHVDLIFQGLVKKSINILINCRNFAIQMTDTKCMDVVITVGNFLARTKDKQFISLYER